MMVIKVLIALFLSAAFNDCLAQSDEFSSAYDARVAQYEDSRDLAWAYRLAGLSAAFNEEEFAKEWLNLLVKKNWKMGASINQFAPVIDSPEVRQILAKLSDNVLPSDTQSHSLWSIPGQDLVIESIAIDSARTRLYVGSLNRKTVFAYAIEAGELVFVSEIGRGLVGAVYGIKLHEDRDELWVLHNSRVEGQLEGAISVFGRDGRLLRTVSEEVSAAREYNDLCFGQNSVFATDSIRGTVLILPFDEDADIYTLLPPGAFPSANGIACDEESTVVYVATAEGVVRFDPDEGSISAIPTQPGESLAGVDGLYLYMGRLYGVQNAMGSEKLVSTDRVSNSPASTSIRVYDHGNVDISVPTTGAMHKGCLYFIARSNLDRLTDEFTILENSSPLVEPSIRVLPLDGAQVQRCL